MSLTGCLLPGGMRQAGSVIDTSCARKAMTARILKWLAIGVPLLLIVAVGLVIAMSTLEHRRLIGQEIAAYPPPGELVSVGEDTEEAPEDTFLHIYAEGQADPTLVLMSGLGTSSPYHDFRPLIDRLSDTYRVVVVERAGYGWSDIGGRPRDVGTVLRETRTALRRAGESGPFVLVPHSLAGLEAVRWAQRYPDEVQQIVGLDPLVPGYHAATGEGASLSRWITFLARTGLMRSGPDVFARNFPAMVEGRLTEEQAAAAEAIFMRRTNTADMWAEVRAMPQNAALVRRHGIPDTPFHAIVSARQPDAWTDAIAAFAEATGGEVVTLDADHYLHVERPDRVATAIRTVLEAAGRD
jgi:pimeloyl-ACP methyl ester carboxylesterase